MPTRTFTDYQGKEWTVDCLGCAIVNHQIDNPGAIIETEHFNVHQDIIIPIPGFVVMASKRHIDSVADLTPEEQHDFIQSTVRIRKTLNDVLGINEVYLIQAETSDHRDGHFHLWFFPRYPWMQEQFGRSIESVRPIMEYARQNLKTPENIEAVNQSVQKLKSALSM